MKKVLVLLLLASSLLACKKTKKQDNVTVVSSKDSIFYIPSAPNDSLRAIYYQENGFKYYFYGEKDISNSIKNIKSAIIKFNGSDTTLNFFFDDSNRVSMIYGSNNAIKDSMIIVFNYEIDSTYLLFYNVDWINGDSMQLKHRVAFKNGVYGPLENLKGTRNGDRDKMVIIKGAMLGSLFNLLELPAAAYATKFSTTVLRGASAGAGAALALLWSNDVHAEEVPYSFAGGAPGSPALFQTLTLLTNNSAKSWTGNWDYDGCIGNTVTVEFHSDFSFSVSSKASPCTASNMFTDNYPKFILNNGIIYLLNCDFLSDDFSNNYPHTIVSLKQHELILSFHYTGPAGSTVTLHD